MAAAALYVYNVMDSSRAEEASMELAEEISGLLEVRLDSEAAAAISETVDKDLNEQAGPEEKEEKEDVVAVGGYEISGILSIPAINVKLAIIHDWSYPNLTVSACRYSGSPDEQMILLAHNYRGHFGSLDKLEAGDTVNYTDINGVSYDYQVTGTELWDTGQLREIIGGDTWDLTLFTCTYSGNSRVVVRCVRM